MSDDILFGVDLDALEQDELANLYPDMVPGRVAHIDADFSCYHATYEREGEEKTFDDMVFNIDSMFTNIKKMCGAESCVLHVTPEGSDKGGRYDQALTKEYQGNRDDTKANPEQLHRMREYLVSDMGAIAHMHQEADDGMAQAGWSAYYSGNTDKVVVCSADKDLRMVPGLYLDITQAELKEVDGTFGEIHMQDNKSGKKLVGTGTKFFWAQMLMGDAADNIQGLSKMAPKDVIKHAPSKAIAKSLALLQAGKTDKGKDLTEKQITMHLNKLKEVKSKACGQILAFSLLENLTTDKECFELVRSLYLNCTEPLLHWETGETVTNGEAFMSAAQLLWMRRDNNPNDVAVWLQEIINEGS